LENPRIETPSSAWGLLKSSFKNLFSNIKGFFFFSLILYGIFAALQIFLFRDQLEGTVVAIKEMIAQLKLLIEQIASNPESIDSIVTEEEMSGVTMGYDLMSTILTVFVEPMIYSGMTIVALKGLMGEKYKGSDALVDSFQSVWKVILTNIVFFAALFAACIALGMVIAVPLMILVLLFSAIDFMLIVILAAFVAVLLIASLFVSGISTLIFDVMMYENVFYIRAIKRAIELLFKNLKRGLILILFVSIINTVITGGFTALGGVLQINFSMPSIVAVICEVLGTLLTMPLMISAMSTFYMDVRATIEKDIIKTDD